MKVQKIDGPGKHQLEVLMRNIQGRVAKVGWLSQVYYVESHMPVAAIAAIQEFGAPSKNIPPRPFFRTIIAENEKNWSNITNNAGNAIARGNMRIGDVLELVGAKAAGDVRKTIANIHTPELKPATIRARMRRRADKTTVGNLTKPLIDTGFMFATLSHKVEDDDTGK